MTTTTAPTLSAPLIAAVRSFESSASTPGFGLELLWSRWIDVRRASAQNSADPFRNVEWSSIADLVTQHRVSHRDGATRFDLLALALIACDKR